jgi:Rps23 Pro-64 3,4-dihydroxylase Tpa1-like proline 4-hydroxylase
MKLEDVINEKWLDSTVHCNQYLDAHPFPHIVMDDFIRQDVLDKVESEFPDLSENQITTIIFNNSREIKLAGDGMAILSPAANYLTSYLNSDLFMNYLSALTSIKEPLISDPYLEGGGYHEIKTGGLLKVHADFNKHPKFGLDRRLNLLIYLNKDWEKDWGGELELFDDDMNQAVVSVPPKFNTAVIFSTTTFTYHGHPDPLRCPEGRSRKSLAYYYFSNGRPENEASKRAHSTLYKERMGEKFKVDLDAKRIILEITPPILIKAALRLFRWRR